MSITLLDYDFECFIETDLRMRRVLDISDINTQLGRASLEVKSHPRCVVNCGFTRLHVRSRSEGVIGGHDGIEPRTLQYHNLLKIHESLVSIDLNFPCNRGI